jgi:hypothetical protein
LDEIMLFKILVKVFLMDFPQMASSNALFTNVIFFRKNSSVSKEEKGTWVDCV